MNNPNSTTPTTQWIWEGASNGRKRLVGWIVAAIVALVLVSFGALRTAGQVAPDSIILYITVVQVLLAALFRRMDAAFYVALGALVVAVVAYSVTYAPDAWPAEWKMGGIFAAQVLSAVASLAVVLRVRATP